QHFALSSTGADFTFIPAVPVKCDMLEAISGGFSVQLSIVKEKPCQSSSSSRKCFPKKRRVRKIKLRCSNKSSSSSSSSCSQKSSSSSSSCSQKKCCVRRCPKSCREKVKLKVCCKESSSTSKSSC